MWFWGWSYKRDSTVSAIARLCKQCQIPGFGRRRIRRDQSFVYVISCVVGVQQLDPKLSMRKHIENIRRDAAIVTTYERYQRSEHHPNKALIQTWRKETRTVQQSYLTRATTLLPEYNLSFSREKIATVAPHPLYKTAYQPTLCQHLIVIVGENGGLWFTRRVKV